MNPPRPHANGDKVLSAALKRLRRLFAAAPHQPNGHTPPPQTAWERATEARLGKIEQQLNNQNRLLLITFVSILADVLLGLAR